jgi:hypothetical protein
VGCRQRCFLFVQTVSQGAGPGHMEALRLMILSALTDFTPCDTAPTRAGPAPATAETPTSRTSTVPFMVACMTVFVAAPAAPPAAHPATTPAGSPIAPPRQLAAVTAPPSIRVVAVANPHASWEKHSAIAPGILSACCLGQVRSLPSTQGKTVRWKDNRKIDERLWLTCWFPVRGRP